MFSVAVHGNNNIGLINNGTINVVQNSFRGYCGYYGYGRHRR